MHVHHYAKSGSGICSRCGRLFIVYLGGFSFFEDILSSFLPYILVEFIVSLSFLAHFSGMVKGVVSLSSVVFFVSIAALFVFLSIVAVDIKKND